MDDEKTAGKKTNQTKNKSICCAWNIKKNKTKKQRF